MTFLSSPEIILLLFLVAIFAGFLDTLAGGGGLIVVPSLLLFGLSPVQVLATNKLQGSFGTLVSTTIFLYKKKTQLDFLKLTFCLTMLGSALGAMVILVIPKSTLEFAIPVVLIVIATYFLFAPTTEKDELAKIKSTTYSIFVAPIIGFYDGAVGPGTGSFFAFTNVVLLGKKLLAATANAKLLNFASNIAALVIFIFSGQIVWLVGLLMAAGTALGAMIGSKVAIAKGSKLIRPFIVTVCLVMLASYLSSVLS